MKVYKPRGGLSIKLNMLKTIETKQTQNTALAAALLKKAKSI